MPKESVDDAVKTISGSGQLEFRSNGWNLKRCHDFKAQELGLYLIRTSPRSPPPAPPIYLLKFLFNFGNHF